MKHRNKKIEIGEKLKNIRLACGYTQEEVCEKIDCSARYICQLETNKTMGSIPLILDLCALYGITLNELYSDYLDLKSNSNAASFAPGYSSLNSEYRSIIDNNIVFLNKLQVKKNEKRS